MGDPVNRILALKDLDFSLDQIKELLKVDLSSEVMEKLLKDKAVELQHRILDENARLMRVEGRLTQLRETLDDRLKLVVLKSSPSSPLTGALFLSRIQPIQYTRMCILQ